MAEVSRHSEPQIYPEDEPPDPSEQAPGPRGTRSKPRRQAPRLLKIVVAVLGMVLLLLIGGLIARVVLGPPPTQPVATSAVPAAKAPTPAALPRFKSEPFGDWFLVCTEPPAARSCIAQQQVMDSAKAVVFTWSMQLDEKGLLRTLWRIPPDAQPQRGFIIDAGDGKPRPVNFTGCDDKDCSVAGVLAPEFLKSLEGAKAVIAAYVSSKTNKPVRISLSSRGLSDVLAELGRSTAGTP